MQPISRLSDVPPLFRETTDLTGVALLGVPLIVGGSDRIEGQIDIAPNGRRISGGP